MICEVFGGILGVNCFGMFKKFGHGWICLSKLEFLTCNWEYYRKFFDVVVFCML